MPRLLVLALAAVGLSAVAADPPKPRPVARLVFQDHPAAALKWADVSAAGGQLALGPVAAVDGFPKLDAARQTLVQMDRVGDKLLVGVRDDEDGEFGSGWVMVGLGVRGTDHGDHSDWSFRKKPFAIGARIDKEQGNPAHVYVYGDKFYLANDRKNGYSRFDPEDFPRAADPHAGTRPRFLPGGGGHITLAVVGDKVGYGTWIGPGRVDVTPVSPTGTPAVGYSFATPSGGLHGATACAGKVFFAPADGVCWVEADPDLKLKPDQVKVNHVPLGKDGDKPLRTGAFAAHGKWVLCVTGKEAGCKLALLDAAAADPKPVFVPLTGGQHHKPLTPAVVLAGGKTPLALVFHDHPKDAEATDRLDVVALDPNGDGDFTDAKVVKSLPVGPSAVDGHHGHHDAAFDANGEWAFFTNPGAGTVSALDLKALEVVATFPVGGTPTALAVIGGRSEH
jgi:hypothetical protein